jgi:hypothetical protein
MADLTMLEKRKLESLLGMSGGYVLDFSNRIFAEFFRETVSRDIYADAYNQGSGSKAHRMRAFWQKEDTCVFRSRKSRNKHNLNLISARLPPFSTSRRMGGRAYQGLWGLLWFFRNAQIWKDYDNG